MKIESWTELKELEAYRTEAEEHLIRLLQLKSPVTALQEISLHFGLTPPKYHLVEMTGPSHRPTFHFWCYIEDIDDVPLAIGTGNKKKEAKQAAAKILLDTLFTRNAKSLSKEETIEKKVEGNPISWLQDLCISRHWPLPYFGLVKNNDDATCPKFIIKCLVLIHSEIGVGFTKKIAKREAAMNMWNYLNQLPLNLSTLDLNPNTSSSQYTDLISEESYSLSYSKITEDSKLDLNDTHSQVLVPSPRNKQLNLQDNCIQYLQEIITDEQITVTYVDIEEKSITGNLQCLLLLSTIPVAVCYGDGKTANDAQLAAAKCALEYLKIQLHNY